VVGCYNILNSVSTDRSRLKEPRALARAAIGTRVNAGPHARLRTGFRARRRGDPRGHRNASERRPSRKAPHGLPRSSPWRPARPSARLVPRPRVLAENNPASPRAGCDAAGTWHGHLTHVCQPVGPAHKTEVHGPGSPCLGPHRNRLPRHPLLHRRSSAFIGGSKPLQPRERTPRRLSVSLCLCGESS